MKHSAGLRPNPQVIARRTEDGMVLVDPVAGKVRVLNLVGADIWEWICVGLTPAEIAARLSQQYTGRPAEIDTDLHQFIGELQQQGLLSPSTGDTSSAG